MWKYKIIPFYTRTVRSPSSILAWRIPWTEEPGGLQSWVAKSQKQLSDWAQAHTIGCGKPLLIHPWSHLTHRAIPQEGTMGRSKDEEAHETCSGSSTSKWWKQDPSQAVWIWTSTLKPHTEPVQGDRSKVVATPMLRVLPALDPFGKDKKLLQLPSET